MSVTKNTPLFNSLKTLENINVFKGLFNPQPSKIQKVVDYETTESGIPTF